MGNIQKPAASDIFIGGAGNDQVSYNNGTFYGGDGQFDAVYENNGTTDSVEVFVT